MIRRPAFQHLRHLYLTIAAALALAVWAGAARSEIGDGVADVALGQSSFSAASGLPLDASTFALPKGVAIDRSTTPNRAYVADGVYHRVLGWADVDALVDGAPADIVLGQADFASYGCNRKPGGGSPPAGATLATLCEPAGLAVSPTGRLYVADSGNCRILAYDDPFSTDQIADQVIGQPNGTSSACSGTATSSNVYEPRGIALDPAGNLFVADTLHCRVLELDEPASHDGIADRVYGQPDFTSTGCSTLYFPSSVALDASGNLWIGSSSRVYEIDAALGPDHTVDRLLGSQTCNDPSGETSSSTCGPIAVALDDTNRLYVADAGNNRVLAFNTPLTVAQAAQVFGQTNFGGSSTLSHDECNKGGPGAGSLCLRRVQSLTLGSTYSEAAALATDAAGRLYVADGLNHRVLRYDAPAATDSLADTVLGHATASDVRKPVPTIEQPSGIAISHSFDVAVVDRDASRVLIYPSFADFADVPVAAIGQPDLVTTGCNSGGLSAASLCQPTAAHVDPNGNLWIADSGNNRVLEYDAPWIHYDTAQKQYVAAASATRVVGQPNAASSACGAGATGLCNPQGVAVDRAGNLYVADSGNNRVVQNQNPLADATFELAFGQATLAGTACNAGGLSADSLCDPRGLAVDASNALFVADRGNNRVLAYLQASAGNAHADRVFGQSGSFAAAAAAAGANGLAAPSDVALDESGNLYVADTANNRLLEIDAAATGDLTADRVFGQPDLSSSACNTGGISAQSLCSPQAVAISSAYFDRIFVADAGNQRVLRYDAPFCRGDFTLTAANRRDHSARSKPTRATLKIAAGSNPALADDVMSFKGGLVLLESDGGISPSDPPLLTLSTGTTVVYQERVPDLQNEHVSSNGGTWATPYLKGERDVGIDDFLLKESFVIPGNPAKPQFDNLVYKGRAVGLDLGAFTAPAAKLRLQFGSLCFTTDLACKTNRTGRICAPAH